MKDLVLIHGWGFDSRVWEPVAERLAGRVRVHLVDLPGYGVRECVDCADTVCAWSLGAQVALRWAAEEPQRVARLVLVGATPRFVAGEDWPHAQPQQVLDDFAAAVDADPRAALRRFAALINQGDSHGRRLTRELAGLAEERLAPAPVLAAGLAALAETDLREAVPRVRQPTLVVHGERDPLMPLPAARWLAATLPDARLETFADTAHAPFLSQPERFADLVAAFANA